MTDPIGIKSSLPPLYAKWVSEALPGGIPAETKATCENCAMCQQAAPNASQVTFFNPKVKCCSYFPDLANFLVGRILEEPDATTVPGRDKLQERISAGIAISPFGVLKPPLYDMMYSQATDFFGKSETMRCPYYIEEGGLCGIWRHRNGVCATWYCKHNRGAVGFTFWRTLLKMLNLAERNLAVWCILQLDLGSKALKRLFPLDMGGRTTATLDTNQLDGIKDEALYNLIWGNWLGRETEYFRACGELVSNLSWGDVLAIGGADLQMVAHLTGEAYGNLMEEEFPSRLQNGSFRIIRTESNRNLVETYSAYDPLSIPRPLMDVLDYFDGRLTTEAIQAIYDEKDLNLTPALVRKLADFQILTPVED